MGERVSDATTIEAPVEVVWRIITDLESYPEWTEGVLETEVLSTFDDGTPHEARFKVDAKVVEVTYTLAYAYAGRDVSWHLVHGETVSQLDGSYQLHEQDGTTEVRYTLDVDVDLPVPGFLKNRAARTILDQGLDGLKRRAEAQGDRGT